MASQPDDLSDHLKSLEERLLAPEVRSSTQAVAAMLTSDFREFGSSGRTYTRHELLAALRAESSSSLTLSDFQMDLASPTVALVTYRSHHSTPQGTTRSALRSSLWLLGPDNVWRMHFHQGTRLP